MLDGFGGLNGQHVADRVGVEVYADVGLLAHALGIQDIGDKGTVAGNGEGVGYLQITRILTNLD